MTQRAILWKGAAPRRRWHWRRALVWLILIATTIVALFPMYWLFVSALTPTKYTINTTPRFFPDPLGFDNFQRLFALATDYWRWFLNSLIVALSVTVFHVIFDTMAGYAFAKRRFPGRNLMFWLILSTLMIPAHVTLVPLYIVTRELKLLDTLLAVILPGTANVFGIFLMRQYIQTMPGELIEAGRIDGANEFGIFWRIILPLCKPAIAALAIFTFVRHWNDFLWPLIVLTRSRNFTLPVGVASLQGEFSTDYGVIFAGAALAALPMIIFFLIFQRYFLEGVRMGAVKG
ncbi:carbohydrate ABC transporter permease [Kallotenue papyrolyticum]|uniref:carbohydrate ABC transporter permease n=1 Tax=Kallotenue papyrolyticum TaxID=1325125 RepID=UPI00046E8322|nr:carbohydrate ABC transporter permease [Kallotenue papyrolyticum]